MLITKDGENLEGTPANPELVSVTFVPKREFMSQMEEMRRIGHAAGIAIGKPNLTVHGERKLALLEAQGVSINRALSNNLSEIKGR
jgi:hypothetical protein